MRSPPCVLAKELTARRNLTRSDSDGPGSADLYSSSVPSATLFTARLRKSTSVTSLSALGIMLEKLRSLFPGLGFLLGQVLQPFLRFAIGDALPEVAPAFLPHPFHPVRVCGWSVFQGIEQQVLPRRIVAKKNHVAPRSERGAGALGDAAGDARAFHREVVAEDDALEAELAAQHFLQPVLRIPGGLRVDLPVDHVGGHDA